jgi:acyl carrier protein
MNRNEVRQAFFELLRSYIRAEGPNSINESSLLVDDLKVNSTRFVDIILETEDRFKISIDDKDMERFERVGDAVDYICERTLAAA